MYLAELTAKMPKAPALTTKSAQVCQPPVLLPTLFWASNPACHLCRLLGEGSAFTESLSHGPITLKRWAQFFWESDHTDRSRPSTQGWLQHQQTKFLSNHCSSAMLWSRGF